MPPSTREGRREEEVGEEKSPSLSSSFSPSFRATSSLWSLWLGIEPKRLLSRVSPLLPVSDVIMTVHDFIVVSLSFSAELTAGSRLSSSNRFSKTTLSQRKWQPNFRSNFRAAPRLLLQIPRTLPCIRIFFRSAQRVSSLQ